MSQNLTKTLQRHLDRRDASGEDEGQGVGSKKGAQ